MQVLWSGLPGPTLGAGGLGEAFTETHHEHGGATYGRGYGWGHLFSKRPKHAHSPSGVLIRPANRTVNYFLVFACMNFSYQLTLTFSSLPPPFLYNVTSSCYFIWQWYSESSGDQDTKTQLLPQMLYLQWVLFKELKSVIKPVWIFIAVQFLKNTISDPV